MRLTALLTIALLCIACGSAQTKPATQLGDILQRAETLRQNGNTDPLAYEALSTDLVSLANTKPDYCNEADTRQAVQRFLENYSALRCELRITEPNEKLITASGFATPVKLTAECPASAPFAFEADSRDIALSGEGLKFRNGSMSALIRVNSATAEAKRNHITFSARYYAHNILGALAAACGQKAEYTIALTPAEYQIRATPVVAEDSYGEHRHNFRKAEFASVASVGEISGEAALSATGQFTVGGVYAGRRFDLLYGHPNGELPDGIGTTFTTIRVDGTDYRFEKQTTKRSRRADGALVAEAAIARTGISVTQILQPEPAHDRIRTRITYEIRNQSKKNHSVGIRLLLDTWAGKNDGVPFLVPAGEVNQLFRTETEFTPAASVVWQTFDADNTSLAAHQPALQGLLVGKDLVPPDRIAIINWPNAVNTLWDYAINSDRRITGDSAAALWWNPAPISAGKAQRVSTEVGAFVSAYRPYVFITNAATGDILVYLWHKNESVSDETVSYKVRAERGDLNFQLDMNEIRLTPQAVFAKASPGQVLVEGETDIVISETINGNTREYRYPIKELKQWKKSAAAAIVSPAKNLPVSYYDERELTLFARLKNSAGREISRIQLGRERIDGGYRYSGNFDIPAETPAGRYSVEVIK